jgi:Fe-S oxidoreductase
VVEQRYYERVKKPEDYSVAKAKQAEGKYPQLDKWKKEFYHCSRCGSCRDVVITVKLGEWPFFDPTLVPWLGPPERYEACPNYKQMRWDHFAPRGRMQILKALAEGWIDLSSALAENVYACVDCGICETVCKASEATFGDPIPITTIMRAWREEIIETNPALLPPEIRDFLDNIHTYSNPWGKAKAEREEWADGTNIPKYKSGDEYLYYVGCEGSYDTRAQKAARALGECFLSAGISFGILGADESCDGGTVYRMGETGLFELLAEENMGNFKKLGVKRVVTLSPHSYDGFKNYYPMEEKEFEAISHPQLLGELIKKDKLKPTKAVKARVTYSDSCFLGRYNKIYEEPRNVLRAIPGVELVEMKRNKEISYCCGGGAGNFATGIVDRIDGVNRPDRFRVKEARDSGASILAVSCPGCLMRLSDALKVEGLEGELEVKEISEILRDSL